MTVQSDFLKRIELTDDDFSRIQKFTYDKFGINLTEAKRNLVSSRLHSSVIKCGCRNFTEYFKLVMSDNEGKHVIEFINKISTNYTYFYREHDHFDFLKQVTLPFIEKFQEGQGKDLRGWCAGCASGEEPYTLIMIMKEYFGNDYDSWDAGLLATDISINAMSEAKKATYSYDRIEKLPDSYKKKFLTKINNDSFKVKDEVQKEVLFRKYNLMTKKPPFKNKFHFIFCRNVMIYFDSKTKIDLANRFADLLVPGGYLFIGHSETLGNNTELLEYIKPAVYRKRA